MNIQGLISLHTTTGVVTFRFFTPWRVESCMWSFLDMHDWDPWVQSWSGSRISNPGSPWMKLSVFEFSSISPCYGVIDLSLSHTFISVMKKPISQNWTCRKKNSKAKMVNETQSFVQYKDKAHALSTEIIQKVIGTESYQQKLVQGWVDSIGQDIINKLRVW